MKENEEKPDVKADEDPFAGFFADEKPSAEPVVEEEAAEETETEEQSAEEPEVDPLEAVRVAMMEKIQQGTQPQVRGIDDELIPREQPKPAAFSEKIDYFTADDMTVEEPAKLAAKFNSVLNEVRNKAIQDTIRTMSPAVNRVVGDTVNLQLGVDKFYRDNSDLVKYKPYVGVRASQIMGQNPGWSLDKLFTELSKEVRKELNLKSGSQQSPVAKKTFVKTPGTGRRAPDTRTAKQKQMDELLNR